MCILYYSTSVFKLQQGDYSLVSFRLPILNRLRRRHQHNDIQS
jgi:hypothetical protein